jgi:hypothetical protein
LEPINILSQVFCRLPDHPAKDTLGVKPRLEAKKMEGKQTIILLKWILSVLLSKTAIFATLLMSSGKTIEKPYSR